MRGVALSIGHAGVRVGKFAPRIAFLLVDGDGIVLLDVDAMVNQELRQMVTLVVFDDVEMVDMTVARQFLGELEAGALEAIGVALGPGAALIGPAGDVLELDTQERGVEIIEAAVETERVHRTLERAMVTQTAHGLFDVGTIGNEGAAVAEGAEVFLDDEAGADGIAELALFETIAVGVDGLGVVFHNPEFVLLSDGADGLHISTMAVEVHGDDADGARGDGGFDLRGVDVVGDRVGIDEDGLAPSNPDGLSGGEEGVGGGDDFVARLDAQREKGQPESVGAGVQPDGMLHSKVLGEFLFETSEGGAHDIGLAFHDSVKGVVDFFLDAVVLAAVAVKRYFQFCRCRGRRHGILLENAEAKASRGVLRIRIYSAGPGESIIKSIQ